MVMFIDGWEVYFLRLLSRRRKLKVTNSFASNETDGVGAFFLGRTGNVNSSPPT